MFKRVFSIGMACATLSVGLLQADTLDIDPRARTSVALSIYNNEFALVNDSYTVNLPEGQSTLNFSPVSPLINHASAVLHPLPDSLRVLDQYFRDAMTPESILASSVGQKVSLVSTHPVSGEQTSQRARVLSVSGGIVLEIEGRYETSLDGRRIVYDQLPQGVLRPTLSVRVDSASSATSKLNLSYLTGGLAWQADYVARLNAANDSIQLGAVASINNNSGVDFRAAQIALIAGSVNRVQAISRARREMAMVSSMADSASTAPAPLADLYVYYLPSPVELANDSARQVPLFEARDVPIKQIYQLEGPANAYSSPNPGEKKLKVDHSIEFSNDSDHQLGMPMPAGVVRVYAQPPSQPENLQFVGEDRLVHTPKDASVRLKIGQAFDLIGRRTQLAFRRLPVDAPFRHHSETKIRIVLNNAKSEMATVRVQEQFSGEWVLVDGPEPVERSARSARWDLPVPALGEATLNLTLRVKR